MNSFVDTPSGTCYLSPLNGEFTLCGNAFDGQSDDPDYYQKPSKSRTVSCFECGKIILEVRSITVRRNRS